VCCGCGDFDTLFTLQIKFHVIFSLFFLANEFEADRHPLRKIQCILDSLILSHFPLCLDSFCILSVEAGIKIIVFVHVDLISAP
jgi:hypothetical protein